MVYVHINMIFLKKNIYVYLHMYIYTYDSAINKKFPSLQAESPLSLDLCRSTIVCVLSNIFY